MYTPLAFLTAGLIALFSAFSFAELTARYPRSAGESVYVMEAFGVQVLSAATGWVVIATGVVSAATLATAIAGFLQDLAPVSETMSLLGVVVFLGLVAAWGIMESVTLAVAITVVEIAGLIAVVGIAGDALLELPARWGELVPPLTPDVWKGIFLGAFLAFYSFIGFEDMVNVAEEVKEPRRNLPLAILLSLLGTLFLYLLVTFTAVLSLPLETLGRSNTPLAEVVHTAGPKMQTAMGVISIFAGVNGALVQIIMAARVAYGMADTGRAPGWFARISPRTRTPLRATGFMTGVILVLALWFPLVPLAQMTSTLILVIFSAVNLSLIVIKVREKSPPEGGPNYPLALPLLGLTSSSGFLLFRLVS